MVTAAALAHVNRLPLLLLPGDVFANRAPDPVLQQVEDFGDGTVSANDVFRPVSRYFDRITRPEQIISALQPRHAGADRSGRLRAGDAGALPGRAGRGLRLPGRDVRGARVDAAPRRARTPTSSRRPLRRSRRAQKPVIIAGGGVLYSEATDALAAFAETHGIPVMETQAGKSSLPHDHPLNMGSVGVTGLVGVAMLLAEQADLVLAVGSRLQDFTTGSWALFKAEGVKIVGAQRAALRRRQAPRAAAGRRRQGRARAARRRRSAAGGADRPGPTPRDGGQGRLAAKPPRR